jgi:uncharacterized protein (DUF2267 family)
MSYLSYEEFVTRVQNRADLSRDVALRSIHAVLRTLAERISGGEARDLASELPPELAPSIGKDQGAPAESFSAAEFYERVAARAKLDRDRATSATEAVFSVLEDSLSRAEISDAKAELPGLLKRLLKTPQR